MEKIWNKIKNYRYKFVTALGTLGVFGTLAATFSVGVFGWIAGIAATFIFGYMIYGMYHAAKNTWNDGDTGSKIITVVYSVLAVGVIGAAIYLVLSLM